jgi:hypothetical protein
MKNTHLFVFALAAALTAAPTFAQQEPDKAPEAPNAHQEQAPVEKDKAAKPAEGDKAKAQSDSRKSDARESKLPQSDQEPGVKNPDAARQNNQEPAARDTRDNRNEASRGDANKHADYHFRGDEKSKLRSSYKDIGRVDRSHRVSIGREQVLPVQVRTRIEPVPVDIVSYLPPVPEGYMVGFVDGYCVVYDPNTFIVVDVIDLF